MLTSPFPWNSITCPSRRARNHGLEDPVFSVLVPGPAGNRSDEYASTPLGATDRKVVKHFRQKQRVDAVLSLSIWRIIQHHHFLGARPYVRMDFLNFISSRLTAARRSVCVRLP
jgi:hypothetical protein